MRVLVTGGTGLVGRRLVQRLRERGDAVVVLTRREAPGGAWAAGAEFVRGDPTTAGPWLDRLADCDAVVHLAGENVFARRWSNDFKARIRASRVDSARVIAEALARRPLRADGRPRSFVAGSAIGYYGPHEDETLTEDSPP